MTISDSRLQFLLSQSPSFVSRLQIMMIQVAMGVLAESGVGATHAARAAYAYAVIRNPASTAQAAAAFFAQSTNVANTITDEDEGPRTTVTDAALLSQITASWNTVAGIDSGS